DGVTVSHNGTGLVLRGPFESGRLGSGQAGSFDLQKIKASHNDVGVSAAALGGVHLGPLKTDHSSTAGVALTDCPDCVLEGVTGTMVTSAGVGVRVGAGATGSSIIGVSAINAGTGLSIDHSAGMVTVARLSVQQDGGTGIQSGADPVTIVDSTISGATIGLDL